MTFDLEKMKSPIGIAMGKMLIERDTEIERLRAENAGLSKAVIDISNERDLAQAEFRAYHKAWEEGAIRIQELEDDIETAKASIRFDGEEIERLRAELASANVELMAAGETVRVKEARIKELEAENTKLTAARTI